MAKRTCCLCNNTIENEERAPILTLGNSGWPRLVCPDCEGRISAATYGKTFDEINEACRVLGDGMIAMRVEDTAVIETVTEIIKTSMERAEQIKNGTYDFSLDEVDAPEEKSEDASFDIPDELRELDEDRALDEKEAKASKIIDTVTSWVAGAILVAAVVFFLIRFVF